MGEFMKNVNTATEKYFSGGLGSYLVSCAAILAIALLLLWALKRVFAKIRQKREGSAISMSFLYTVLKALIIFLAIMGITYQIKPLQSISVSLLASSGILAVILGMASQDACSNIIGGVFISLFKPFDIGDRLRVVDHNIIGIVEDITIRHTVIRTFENNRIILPNKVMNSAVLENSQYFESISCNFLDIPVSYEADTARAMEIVQEICEAHPDCIDNRTPEEAAAGAPKVVVRLTEFLDSAINLRAFVWSADMAKGAVMLCDLRLAIKKRFDEENIAIPYPQRDVYLHKVE